LRGDFFLAKNVPNFACDVRQNDILVKINRMQCFPSFQEVKKLRLLSSVKGIDASQFD
jgi:hypothetical protein